MNRDPFLRAALIVTLTAFAAVLYAFFGPWRALVLAAVGVGAAVFLTGDYDTPPPDEPKETVQPDRHRTVLVDGEPHDVRRLDRAS